MLGDLVIDVWEDGNVRKMGLMFWMFVKNLGSYWRIFKIREWYG